NEHSGAKAINPRGSGTESLSARTLPSLKSVRSLRLPSCQVDRRRRPVVEALVQAFVVVEPEVAGDARSCLRHRRVILQVHLLVFQRSPQALDKDVVHAAPAPVHTDGDPAPRQLPDELLAGELRSLIAVEDVRPAP